MQCVRVTPNVKVSGDFERKKNEQRPLATQKQRHEMRNVHVVCGKAAAGARRPAS